MHIDQSLFSSKLEQSIFNSALKGLKVHCCINISGSFESQQGMLGDQLIRKMLIKFPGSQHIVKGDH